MSKTKKIKCLYCCLTVSEDHDFEYHEKCSVKIFGSKIPPVLPYTFSQMYELAKSVVERNIAVPGVQSKISLSGIDKKIKDATGRLTVIGGLGGNYILKPPHDFYPEMPANEHITLKMAELFGIHVVDSSLIRLQSGELCYITKRIDRTKSGNKIHMLDMYQVTDAVDKYKSSLERIGKAINEFSDNTLLDQLRFFELCVFSFLTGNNDMHLKNYSLIRLNEMWQLAQAYDLLNVAIVNPKDVEETALTIEGKKKKLKRLNFDRLAKGLGLNEKQTLNVFSNFSDKLAEAKSLLKKSFLSKEMKDKYETVLNDRAKKLELK